MAAVPPPSQAFLSQTLQPNIYGAAISTYCLAVIAVFLRFLARRLQRIDWWLDDYLVLAALVFGTCGLADIVVWIYEGVGLHYQAIDAPYTSILRQFFINLFIEDILYSVTLSLVKLSILAFYWRVFKPSSIRLPIKIMAVVVLCWFIARVTASCLQCIPLEGFWDRTIPAYCGVNDRDFFFGTVIPHLLIDVVLIAMPMPYIRQLQINSRQKLGIYGIFMLGGFICIATIIQLYICWNLDVASPDVTWIFAPVGLWAIVEVNLSITSSCLPLLRPIYTLVTGGSMTTGISRNTKTSQNKTISASRTYNSHLLKYPRDRPFLTSDSHSPHPFVIMDEENNNSFTQAALHSDQQNKNPPNGSDIIALDQMNVMVKKEVHIDIRDKEARSSESQEDNVERFS